jgi:hypothetical protein
MIPNQWIARERENLAGSLAGGLSRNGSLIRTIASETAGDAASRTAGAYSSCRPSAISSANGTKNLIEALNHNKYRTCAALLRNRKASAATAMQNSVDCQR